MPCRLVQPDQVPEFTITLKYKSFDEVENTISEQYKALQAEALQADTRWSDLDFGQYKAMLGIDMGVNRQVRGGLHDLQFTPLSI